MVITEEERNRRHDYENVITQFLSPLKKACSSLDVFISDHYWAIFNFHLREVRILCCKDAEVDLASRFRQYSQQRLRNGGG